MSRSVRWWHLALGLVGASVVWVSRQSPALGQGQGPPPGGLPVAGPPGSPPQPEFPPYAEVIKGYDKVESPDRQPTLYTIWQRPKDGQMLAELPIGYEGQRYFIALTIASGERYAGLQLNDMYVYWRRYDKRLALIEPNIGTRSTGDQESQSSVKRLFTDRVILDVPIVTLSPMGTPVIDMDALLVGQAPRFFGSSAAGANPMLASIKKAKAFPSNVELAFEVPTAGASSLFSFSSGGSSGGRLKTLHYSISLIPDNTGYTPRKADERVGYFATAYNDLGKFNEPETWTRYINRWHLQKADPSLKLSPPKNPIVFYIEHSTPVRYRRWVRQGVLYWNQAFEKVGLADAIQVYYQDASTGAYMDKDPEDVRYNFVRWLNNNEGTAIGPSRVHPLTGQILDADIILTDGWIRHFWQQYKEFLPQLAMEGFGPETLAWLERRPNWDPRIRLAAPGERDRLLLERARRGLRPYGGHPMANVDPTLLGDDEYDGLVGRTSQVSGACMAATGKAFDLALVRMSLDMGDEIHQAGDKPDTGDVIDGVPESFIGPLLAELVAHEVGHTLGLRHNFKATSVYSLADISGDNVKGKKPFAGSVMDYIPVNINLQDGKLQGDFTMLGIGPYDTWAIEYGYTFAQDLKPVLERVAEPELQYATDEDAFGPDPLARRYDFSANPLDYAQAQMRLAKHHRERLIDKFVKDGENWSKARRGYMMTLGMQVRSLSMMANWLGGAFVNRDKKGDKNGRLPVQVVPADKQRAALDFVIKNTFYDEAFGLTPDLLSRMTVDKWWDEGGIDTIFSEEPTWPVHDRIMGIQASVLTALMNPTTLRRVYDNEFRVPADQDTVTLPELLDALSAAIWSELDKKAESPSTARKPLISSLRRNLQREHLERLIDLSMPGAGDGAAYKPISNLATMKLRQLTGKINQAITGGAESMIDPYSLAHLTEAKLRIDKALDAQFIYNANDIGGYGSIQFLLFQPPTQPGTPRDH
ncbi:MAG: zinc-dependent metalloprotease [Planctomycetes bacterium]|nr:zinc-dependent metalloprotease [Planctomycetota bacterium]